MLSICIPIYNFDITELVQELSNQINAIEEEVDIILIDDCSERQYKKLNEKVVKSHTYIKLEHNVGRAKIRNLFLNYTKADYLLFLDCDSKIITENFVQSYLKAINKNKSFSVFCGGRIYPNQAPTEQQKLSWKYGVRRESKSYTERQEKPYASFMTNNFVVERSILETIPFDERLTKYGHEDTLFGYYLKKNKTSVLHLNNSVLNGDIEENEEYLNKTKLAIENLVVILENIEDSMAFIEDVKLLSFYYKFKPYGVIKFLKFFSPILNSFFLFQLKQGKAYIRLFNIFKLNYLSNVIK